MAFHDQLDESFTLLIGLREELFRCGPDRFGIRLDLNLSDRLDSNCDALLGVQILLWSDIK